MAITQKIKTIFKIRRGSFAKWKEKNPILRPGEPGFSIDTNELKIGDGITPWNELNLVNNKTAVITRPTVADFPTIGNTNVIYKAQQENRLYQWDNSVDAYVVVRATADDVYDWAKAQGIDILGRGEGNVISNIYWDSENSKIVFTKEVVVNTEDFNNLVAKLEKIEEDYLVHKDLQDYDTLNIQRIEEARTAAKEEANVYTTEKIQEVIDGPIKASNQEISLIKNGEDINSFKDVEEAFEKLPKDKLETGSEKGSVSFNGENVFINGLGSAAFSDTQDYATAEQGQMAEDAIQNISIRPGSKNGTIKLIVDDEVIDNISITGLGSAAYSSALAFEEAGMAQRLINSLDAVISASPADNNKYSVLTGITQTNGKITSKSEVKLSSVARTGKFTDLSFSAGDNIIINCGTSTTVI